MSSYSSTSASLGPPAKRARNRRLLRKYDPEEERAILQEKLEEERAKRRDLESEIYRLRQERSEMCMKMSKLETSKIAPNIPQSLVPMLADTMAKGGNPLQAMAGISTANPVRLQYTTPAAIRPPPTKPNRIVTAASGSPRLTAPKNTTIPVVKSNTPSQYVILPTTLVSTPTGNVSTMPVATSAAGGTQPSYVVQHKTSDGKVMSFLIPANSITTAVVAASRPTGKEDTTTTDKSGMEESMSADDQATEDSADDTEKMTEEASPESPPPEQLRPDPDVVTIED